MSESQPAILLVDHGRRRANANDQLEAIARLIREREPGRVIVAAHMEIAAPSVGDGIDECVSAGADAIVVLPYMLAAGRHSTFDIPNLAAEAAKRYPGVVVTVGDPLGVHPMLVDIVLERVSAASS